MTDPAQLFSLLVTAFNQSQWQRAKELAPRVLKLAPRHPLVCYIAGVAHMELQEMPYALTYLHEATLLEPGRADFAVSFAKALILVRRTREALLAADKALALMPQDQMAFDTLGVVYTQANAHARAATAFRHAVELAPAHAPYRFNLATALVAVGELDSAESELEACIGLDPTYWKAHLTLSQLRRQTPDKNHVARLLSLLPRAELNAEGQTYLSMSLAKEYEDLGEYSSAFEYFVRGKSATRAISNYSIASDEALFEALTNAFPEPEETASGDPTDEPIFVIGMPRTGTTLVERIITSHPQVYSAGELQNFAVLLKRASGSKTQSLFDKECIASLKHVDWKQLGADYLASTRPATGDKAHFIDKLPHNFLFVGFIAHALPNAKIICLRRDPVDTCLSNFRQLFSHTAQYYGYSFDLLDTGRYYALFDRLMAHWKRVFPGRILELEYEALVDSQEEQSRRLLDFCGLSWDESVLRFEENQAPVSTASAVQVRAPIYRTSMKRWKKYEAHLGDLQNLLAQSGIALDR
jgi:tetratricopeptide (TPR) repeat protein